MSIGVKQRHGDGKWEARAVVKRKDIHVGTFHSEGDAAKARDIYILLNHPYPESCTLNYPRLANKTKAELSALMPDAIGTLNLGQPREPLSQSGEKYISTENGSFIFRKSWVNEKGERVYVRVNCKTMSQAKAVRKKYLERGYNVSRR